MSPETLRLLLQGLTSVTWQSAVMLLIGLLLVWLASKVKTASNA